jgi:hypothetical protein
MTGISYSAIDARQIISARINGNVLHSCGGVPKPSAPTHTTQPLPLRPVRVAVVALFLSDIL